MCSNETFGLKTFLKITLCYGFCSILFAGQLGAIHTSELDRSEIDPSPMNVNALNVNAQMRTEIDPIFSKRTEIDLRSILV